MSCKISTLAQVAAMILLVFGNQAHAKTAFVLSGGGSKGSFEIGVLKKLYEKGIEPDILVGTSVGAINAAKLAEGGQSSMAELYDIWMSLRNSTDMYLPEHWFAETKEFKADLERQSSDIEAIGDAITLPWRLKEAADQLDKARSLYHFGPIEFRLRYCLDTNKLGNSGKILRISAVHLPTGNLAFIDQKGMLQYANNRSATYPVDLRKAVLASASIPIVFPPPGSWWAWPNGRWWRA